MDIKNTAITATMVIQSLVKLLENEDVDISSVKFKVGSESNDYESPEFELEKLIDLAVNGLDEIKQTNGVPEGFVLVPSGVLDLTRFMCETWTEIDKFVYKNCQNLELYPLIQGSKTQSAIRKIGQQKFNPFSVGAGIQAMIEAQEQGHENE